MFFCSWEDVPASYAFPRYTLVLLLWENVFLSLPSVFLELS
ncbi:hypothetical protein EDWATA_01418 [Edwardsiella tarda ATCC 23685]|uniref:Uncharacterized protein n=1 Tax=Edwardsiella tarda ATCC 23685 TaxID=500638 RepID=D4F3V3_EDWTA|nr:hypothetical protein EDWATA_01418 [Edwardsiella tarda ATCC 23685]